MEPQKRRDAQLCKVSRITFYAIRTTQYASIHKTGMYGYTIAILRRANFAAMQNN